MGKIIVLVSENCPSCNIIREKIGNDERFKILDVHKDEEAKTLVSKLDIKAVPTFLFMDEETKKVCLIDEKDMGKCVGKEELEHGERKSAT